MKHITLIHTIESVYHTFPQLLKKAFEPEEIEISSIVDEFLYKNIKKTGSFTMANRRKLMLDILSAEAENPDVIIVTCSSLTPYVGEVMDSFKTPIVRIDSNMCKLAAEKGNKIAVIATASTTVGPTVSFIQSFADQLGKKIEIKTVLDENAKVELESGNVDKHDTMIAEMAATCPDCDVVVLAQASMATALEKTEKLCPKTLVLTSPGSAIQEAKDCIK